MSPCQCSARYCWVGLGIYMKQTNSFTEHSPFVLNTHCTFLKVSQYLATLMVSSLGRNSVIKTSFLIQKTVIFCAHVILNILFFFFLNHLFYSILWEISMRCWKSFIFEHFLESIGSTRYQSVTISFKIISDSCFKNS